jgi:hypothetical protein
VDTPRPSPRTNRTRRVPQTGGLTDELLARALPLLECAGDEPALVELLLFLQDGAPPPLPPSAPRGAVAEGGTLMPRPLVPLTLRAHLHLVRALGLAPRAWESGVKALLRVAESATQAQRRAGAALLELLFAMTRQVSRRPSRVWLIGGGGGQRGVTLCGFTRFVLMPARWQRAAAVPLPCG